MFVISVNAYSSGYYASYNGQETGVYTSQLSACLALSDLVYPDYSAYPLTGTSGTADSGHSGKCTMESGSYRGSVYFVEDDDGGSDDGGGSFCDSATTCRAYSLSQYPNCQDGARDVFTFFYTSPSVFSTDGCSTCSGPTASDYSECDSSYCEFGYNAEELSCWTQACPYGDCPDSGSGGNSGGGTGETSNENVYVEVTVEGGDLTVVNESIVSIRNNITDMKPDLEELLEVNKDILLENKTNSSSTNTAISSQTMSLETTIKDFRDLSNLNEGYQLSQLYRMGDSINEFSGDYSANSLLDRADLEEVANGVNNISNSLDKTISIAENSFIDLGAARVSLESRKSDWQTIYSSIQTDITSTLEITLSGSGSLGCSEPFTVYGEQFLICLSDYEDQLEIIANGLYMLSIICAGFIILGGIRV